MDNFKIEELKPENARPCLFCGQKTTAILDIIPTNNPKKGYACLICKSCANKLRNTLSGFIGGNLSEVQ